MVEGQGNVGQGNWSSKTEKGHDNLQIDDIGSVIGRKPVKRRVVWWKQNTRIGREWQTEQVQRLRLQ